MFASLRVKSLILSACLSLFLFHLQLPVFAETDTNSSAEHLPVDKQDAFDTEIISTYSINNQGITSVTHQVSLTNKFPTIYVTQYSFSVGSTRISHITAKAIHGAVETKVITGENTTNIQVKFQDPLVGLNRELTFTVSYQNDDVANLLGKVLEIHIPKIADIHKIQNYSIILNVPNLFGPASIIDPSPSDLKKTKFFTSLTFNQESLGQRGISAFFGDHQIFSFTLNYHLKNPSAKTAPTQIAFPPDSPYQRLTYDLIEPKPVDLFLDADGNWLATYLLKPNQNLLVTAKGAVILYFTPQSDVPLFPQDLNQLLSAQKYWPVSETQILSLANSLKTPAAIYRYVVDSLTYDYSRINDEPQRKGALTALSQSDQAICQEFTDLFVTLSRAADIPARAINGFAYTANPKLRPLSLAEDILHSWPEYYDSNKKLWVPVDPTWEDTTGGIDYFHRWDLNHFSFAIHGASSENPPPAGAYKSLDQRSKDVLVEFSNQNPTINQDVQIEFDFPDFAVAGLTNKGAIKLIHKGNAAIYNLSLTINSDTAQIMSESTTEINYLLPFSAKIIPVKFKNHSLLSTKPISLTAVLNDNQSNSYEIPIKLFSQTKTFYLFAGLTLFAALSLPFGFIFAPKARRLLVSFSKFRSPLRR